jgi:hypothetical protein
MRINGHESSFDWSWSTTLTKNKAFEFQTYWCAGFWNWFNFNMGWSRKGDHCGFIFGLEILGWVLTFNLYDTRHWYWEKDRFYGEGEEAKLVADLHGNGEGCFPKVSIEDGPISR